MYNFELESFQHFLPFCLFLKCWWRNCSISCIPLTAAETFLPSVTCFSLLKSPTTQSKTQFPISSHECLKMPRIRLEWASEGTLSILTFTVSFLLSRDWTHWCSVCFSYPAQQQDNSSPFPPPSSVHPSILKLDSPPHPHPTLAIWKHQSILQATVPSHSLGGQLSFITHCAVRQQHRSIFQFHNRVREEGGETTNWTRVVKRRRR